MQRARQLVDSLWARGSGASSVEQTAGRWIAYQAQIVASGNKGVVAYRLKQPATNPALTAARASDALPRARPPARRPRASAATPTAYRVHVGPAENLKPAPASAPVSVATPESMPVLVRGAGIKPKPPSPNVKLLQTRLGLSPVDGQFGKETEKAVRAYQKGHGLIVDGIVGPDTWSSLFAVRA